MEPAKRLAGCTVPDVALAATSRQSINLGRLQGRSVVFCYPWTGRPGHPNPPNWDDIPSAHGSTPQAEAYGRLHGELAKLRVQVFGLSLQDTDWQTEFATRLALPFALLSDVARGFSRPLDLPTFETGSVVYLRRLTLVVNDGRIEAVRYPIDVPGRDAEETLALLSSR
jgi:peroxiredoxin